MGKYLDCYEERKEFFEGIIDGVFYVKKYAFPLRCDCKQENQKRRRQYIEEVEKHNSLMNDTKLVQNELDKLEKLNEEKEYYEQQNQIFKHFENYQQIGKINAQIQSSFIHNSPKICLACCKEPIFKKLFSKKDFKSYFLISNTIVLKFEINSVDSAQKLELFYEENVQLSYDENDQMRNDNNQTESQIRNNSEQATNLIDQINDLAFLSDGDIVQVGNVCSESEFNSIIRDLNHGTQSQDKVLKACSVEFKKPKQINSDSKKSFQTLFKKDNGQLSLIKIQQTLKEIDKSKVQLHSYSQPSKILFDKVFMNGETGNSFDQLDESKTKSVRYPKVEFLVKGRIIVELMNGQKLTFSDEQFKEFKYALSKAKSAGRYNQNLDIKGFLETFEKHYEDDKSSFKYINKPVLDEEPLNVSKANFLPFRKWQNL